MLSLASLPQFLVLPVLCPWWLQSTMLQLASRRPDRQQIRELGHILVALPIFVRLLVTLIVSSNSSLLVNSRQTYLEPDGVARTLTSTHIIEKCTF